MSPLPFHLIPTPVAQVTFASPRSIVQGREFGRKTVFKHSEYLQTTNIIVAACVSVSTTSISLDNGQTLDFDFLCLCTGSTYSTFKAREDGEHDMETRLRHYDSEAEKYVGEKCSLVNV